MTTPARPKPAAPKPAAPQPAPLRRPGDGRGRLRVIAIFLSGAGAGLALYALPLFILLYGGFLPTMVAFLTNERDAKHLVVTVGALNGAGVMLALRPLFASSFAPETSYAAVGDPSAWFAMYGFAMVGWLLAWLMPLVVGYVLDTVYRQRARTTQAARDALTAQWPGLIGRQPEEEAPDEEEKPEPAPARRRGATRAAKS
jgi:hypothetical protein